jgi:hypothetical protein
MRACSRRRCYGHSSGASPARQEPAISLLAAGCRQMPAGVLMTSLYEHAGGEEALHGLEDVSDAMVLADPRCSIGSGRASRSTSIT